jgi:hypothetical protein
MAQTNNHQPIPTLPFLVIGGAIIAFLGYLYVKGDMEEKELENTKYAFTHKPLYDEQQKVKGHKCIVGLQFTLKGIEPKTIPSSGTPSLTAINWSWRL